MVTKGTIIAYTIVAGIVAHKLTKDYLFPALLYLFGIILLVAGGYYLYFGWVLHSILYLIGGVILLRTLWKT